MSPSRRRLPSACRMNPCRTPHRIARRTSATAPITTSPIVNPGPKLPPVSRSWPPDAASVRYDCGVTDPRLVAVSDLHVRYPDNRAVVESLRPTSSDDWLIVAGDVAEQVEDITWALGLLRERFARVLW